MSNGGIKKMYMAAEGDCEITNEGQLLVKKWTEINFGDKRIEPTLDNITFMI